MVYHAFFVIQAATIPLFMSNKDVAVEAVSLKLDYFLLPVHEKPCIFLDLFQIIIRILV